MTRQPFPERCNCGALDCPKCRPNDWNRPAIGELRAECHECDGDGDLWIFTAGVQHSVTCDSCDGRGWVPVVSETTKNQEAKE